MLALKVADAPPPWLVGRREAARAAEDIVEQAVHLAMKRKQSERPPNGVRDCDIWASPLARANVAGSGVQRRAVP